MERVGLMGGSFNPIHKGHVNMARAALSGGYVDRVIFLPSGNPPHKKTGLEDKEDRYRMTCLAIEGEAKMSVSREEIDRTGVIYTVDTLSSLRRQMPDAVLYYLIGADTVHQLHTWRRIDEVIRLCEFLVMMRPGEDEEATLTVMENWKVQGAKMTLMKGRLHDVSSSEIRDRLTEGESADQLLPDAVLRYIHEHQLYQAGDQHETR